MLQSASAVAAVSDTSSQSAAPVLTAAERRRAMNSPSNRGPHAIKRFLTILRAKRVTLTLDPGSELNAASVGYDVAETLQRSGMIRQGDVDEVAIAIRRAIMPDQH